MCQRDYLIRPPKVISALSGLVIDFAICPFCLTPRRQDLFNKYWGRDRCWICGVPLICFGKSDQGFKGLCPNHYMAMRDKVK